MGWRSHLVDFGPLRRHRDFRLVFTARAVSVTGTMITYVALPAQVWRLTRSTLLVGLVGVAELVPLLASALVGGALADRGDRRRIALVTELAAAAGMATLVLNARLGAPRVWPLFVWAALASTLDGFGRPALESLRQVLVEPDELPAAESSMMVVNTALWVLGPALGGVLVATAGFGAAFTVDAASFLVSAAVLSRVRSRDTAREAPTGSPFADIAEGLRYARSRPELIGTYVIDLNALLFGMPVALFPALAELFRNRSALGLLYAAPGLGSLLASVGSGRVGSVVRRGPLLIAAVVAWGLAITAFGLVRSLPLALAFLTLAGAADMASGLVRVAIWDQTIPNEARGRLAGIELLGYSVGPLLGNIEAGLVATLFSVRTSIVSGGLLCLAGTAVIAVAMPRFRRYRHAGVVPLG